MQPKTFNAIANIFLAIQALFIIFGLSLIGKYWSLSSLPGAAAAQAELIFVVPILLSSTVSFIAFLVILFAYLISKSKLTKGFYIKMFIATSPLLLIILSVLAAKLILLRLFGIR